MKINIDWFVLNPIPNNYNCSRWCYSCISSNRNEEILSKIDLKFLVKFSYFAKKNNLTYNSLSLNQCWDFVTNIAFIKKYIYTLMKLKILKRKDELLVYTKIKNINGIFDADVKEFIDIFQPFFSIKLWISVRLNEDILTDDIPAKLHLLKRKNIESKLILHREINSSSNRVDKNKTLNVLRWLLDSGTKLYFTEGEWTKVISYIDLSTELFSYSWEKECSFLSKNYISDKSKDLDILMFDFSENQIMPHWPYCSSIKELSIWNIKSKKSDLIENSIVLKKSLESMSNDYKNKWKDWNICNFCQSYFVNHYNNVKNPSSKINN